MAKQRLASVHDIVSVFDDPDVGGALRFTFVPKSDQATGAEGEAPPTYVVSVQGYGDDTEFNWIRSPAQETIRATLEELTRQRVTARAEWLDRLNTLVQDVKRWADELDWATRVVRKRMEDPEIGNYEAPALLLQKETVRLFLEPVARAAPGVEGLVDLYLMPAYDDIASLYYYDGRWNVHYMFEETPTLGNIREVEAKPFAKSTLEKVFDEMKAHAG